MTVKLVKEFFNASNEELLSFKKEDPQGFKEVKSLVEEYYKTKEQENK